MARPGRWDFDMYGDFRVADGPECVRLRRQTPDGAFGPSVNCDYALRETLNKKTAAGMMEAADIVWHLDAEEVGEIGVARGDLIIDCDGIEYRVESPTLAGASDQWRCPSTVTVSSTFN